LAYYQCWPDGWLINHYASATEQATISMVIVIEHNFTCYFFSLSILLNSKSPKVHTQIRTWLITQELTLTYYNQSIN